jgi:hypothetical protein
MTATIDNLKNLCNWVRRNYPKIAHLTNEDLAILPLQEWWERDHQRKSRKTLLAVPPPPPRVGKPPPPVAPVLKLPVAKPPRAIANSTDYKMRRIEIAQKRRLAARRKGYRPSVSSEREWPVDPSQGWRNSGPRGSISNPWRGGKCSPR